MFKSRRFQILHHQIMKTQWRKYSTQHVNADQKTEKIKHFEFPPWQHPAKFQCHISPASKEQAKEAYLAQIDQL